MKLIFVLLLMSSVSFARGGGYSAGDGGHGVKCGSIVQLLDLYEARTLYGFKPSFRERIQEDWSYYGSAVSVAYYRFKEAMPMSAEMKTLFRRALYTAYSSDRVDWEWAATTNDAGPLLVGLRHGCRISQVANYSVRDGRETIRINEALWTAMDFPDQGATILHEAFHAYFHQRTTLAIRQFVTYLSAPDAFRARNRAVFQKLVTTREAVDPHAFR